MELKKSTVKDLFCCLILALIVSLQFELNLFYESATTTDSSVFIYIGKQMHNGFVPYKDLFDHKGIILYFIEYLGTFFPYRIGIGLIEIVNMWAFLWFALKLTKKYVFEFKYQVIVLVIVSVVCGAKVYEGGNLVEEYALPWIMVAVGMFDDYLDDKESLTKCRLIILGIGFAFVSLLRPNMVAVWIFFGFLVIYDKVRALQYKALANNILYFFVGTLLLYIPCLLYFVLTDSLNDMVACFWTFNVEYTGSLYNDKYYFASKYAFLPKFIYFPLVRFYSLCMFLLKYFLPGTVSFIWALILCREKKKMWINFCMIGLAILFMQLSGRSYGHYLIVLLPLTITSVCHCVQWLKYRLIDKRICNLVTVFLFLCVMSFQGIVGNVQFKIDAKHPIVDYMQNIPAGESVLIFGNACWYYLWADKFSDMKYFYQYPPCSCSGEIYSDFLRDFENKMPKNIIVGCENKYEHSVNLKKKIRRFFINDEIYFVFKNKIKRLLGRKENKKLVYSSPLSIEQKKFLELIKDKFGYEKKIDNGVIVYKRSDKP